MGETKALLKYKGETFIENICRSLRENKIPDRIVVLGDNKKEILSNWTPSGEKTILNKNPEAGQISSLRAGLENANSESKAVLIALVDQPTIKTQTYKNIIDFWLKHQDCIIIPKTLRVKERAESREQKAENIETASRQQRAENIINSSFGSFTLSPTPSPLYKRGHPIIIPKIYWHLCFDGPDDKGLHWVTHHPEVKVLDLFVDDDNILKDFDTPEDYNRLNKERV